MAVNLVRVLVALSVFTLCLGNDDTSCTVGSSVCGQQTTEPITPASSEMEAVNQAWCYASCAGANIMSVNVTGHSWFFRFNVTGLDRIWPSVSISSLTCDSRSMILTCQRGCLILSSNTTLSLRQCEDQCLKECDESSMETTVMTSSCTQTCDRTDCAKGCSLQNEVIGQMDSDNSSNSSVPLLSPALIKRENVTGIGQYLVDYLIPVRNMSENIEIGVFSFVFKVEGVNGGYFHLASLDDILDLGMFSCQRTDISFAAVNSRQPPPNSLIFSPELTQFCVDGVLFPRVIRLFAAITNREEDFREGFIGSRRAVITIQWQTVPRTIQFVTGYRVRLSTSDPVCGGPGMRELSTITQSIVISARNTTDMPTFGNDGCSYTIGILPLPARDPTAFIIGRARLTVNTATLAYSIVANCSVEYDEITGLVSPSIQWHVQPPELGFLVPDTLGQLTVFYRNAQYTEDGEDFEFIPFPILGSPKITSVGSFSISQSGLIGSISLQSNGSGEMVLNRVRPSINPPALNFRIDYRGNETAYRYRRNPALVGCFQTILPFPPTPISQDAIIINDFILSGDAFNLSLSWTFPRATYGIVNSTQIIILKLTENSTDEVSRDITLIDEDLLVKTFNFQDSRTRALIINEEVLNVEEDILCFELLMRYDNTVNQSEWSSPVLLTRNDNVTPNCTLALPTLITSTEASRSTAWWVVTVPVLAVLAVLFAIILIPVAMILTRNYQNKQELKGMMQGSRIMINSQKSTKLPGAGIPNRSSQPLVPYYKPDKWDIPESDIILGEQLGSGFFGTVYRGIVQRDFNENEFSDSVEKRKNSVGCIIVAVKMLKAKATFDEKKRFLDEIDLMKKISSSGGSPHIVQMVGCVTATEPFCLLIEFVEHGDLLEYLKSIRSMVYQSYNSISSDSTSESCTYAKWDTVNTWTSDAESTSSSTESSKLSSHYDRLLVSVIPYPESSYARLGDVSASDLIMFGAQIASGMDYLGSINVIHRDLSCRNILVGTNKSLKITDFGLSRAVSEERPVYSLMTSKHLPFRWMALECLKDRDFTVETDVWSFGVTMWEIASLGGYPYPTIANNDLQAYLEAGKRLEKPSNCNEDIYQLMLQCWNEDPSKRPTFTSLKEKLESFSSYTRLPLQFPKKSDQDHPYSSDKKAARKQQQLESEDLFNLPKRHSFHHGNDYHLAGTLTIHQDVRRVSSEPVLDDGMEFFTVPSGGSSRERSLTNSYVDLPPSQVTAAKRKMSRRKSRERIMLKLDVPQVHVSSANDD